MTEITVTDAAAHLPPGIAGYVVLAAIVLWMARRTYGETGAAKEKLLDRYAARLDQVEHTLSHLTQELDQKNRALERALEQIEELRLDLAEAREAEERCSDRMERLEARYEKRIAELEDEIDCLRAQLSEPMEVV